LLFLFLFLFLFFFFPPANRFDLRCLLLLLLLLQTTFARYAERTAFERPLTSGVAYAVKVTHAEREQFERQQGWSIKKMYSSKKQSTGAGDAEVREPAEEYAPVIFAQDAYKHVVSFDMLSGNVSTLRLSVSRFLSSFFTPMPTGTRGLLQKKKAAIVGVLPCAHCHHGFYCAPSLYSGTELLMVKKKGMLVS
jgi:hypothetical protein